jgi:hypothetical protein
VPHRAPRIRTDLLVVGLVLAVALAWLHAAEIRLSPCESLGPPWTRAIRRPPLVGMALVGLVALLHEGVMRLRGPTARPSRAEVDARAARRAQRAEAARDADWAGGLVLLAGPALVMQHLAWAWPEIANCRVTAPRILEGVVLLDSFVVVLGAAVAARVVYRLGVPR